jgi:hypothetical protein
MTTPRIFRRALAVRILASLGIAQAACGEGTSPSSEASTGTGTTSTTTTSTTTTTTTTTTTGAVGDGGADGMVSCFPLQTEGGTCPTDLTVAFDVFTSQGCVTTWEVTQVLSGPIDVVAGQCCYMADIQFCSGPTGRAYLVDHRPRIAAPRRGPDTGGWAEGAAPGLAGLAAADRAALAEAWAADALQEHASVASFSRASLALLAAGAPADLVEDTHRAALDEVRHAQLCFALASAYGGEAIAPGPFPLGGEVRVSAGFAALVESTVEEGCLGETVAAVIAAEQLARAVDPAVRAALARIAADEARHAELAWRTVAWAVRAGGVAARAAFEQALVAALGRVAGARASGHVGHEGGSAAMAAHGRLDAATTARVTANAVADIVSPAARALLQDRSPPSQRGPDRDDLGLGCGRPPLGDRGPCRDGSDPGDVVHLVDDAVGAGDMGVLLIGRRVAGQFEEIVQRPEVLVGARVAGQRTEAGRRTVEELVGSGVEHDAERLAVGGGQVA